MSLVSFSERDFIIFSNMSRPTRVGRESRMGQATFKRGEREEEETFAEPQKKKGPATKLRAPPIESPQGVVYLAPPGSPGPQFVPLPALAPVLVPGLKFLLG